MIPLNKADRQRLVNHEWPLKFNRETRVYEADVPEGREELLSSFQVLDTDYFIGMDNHGVNMHVCVYRETTDGPLLGFLHGQGSEDHFYDPDYFGVSRSGPFELSSKVVEQTLYERADGIDFDR